MNPLTNVKNIAKLNEVELAKGTIDKKSWHDMYKDSAWIFLGGLAYGLTEGDILSVFSQYGEIVNINLVRDKKTGKTKGFCFLCYANQKSTILAVDNFNGIKLCGRTIRVDHVANYKPPKENEDEDEITKQLKSEGCAPKPIKIENTSEVTQLERRKKKKIKKEKKKHQKHKKKNGIKDAFKHVRVKEEKIDAGYTKYEIRKSSSDKKTAKSDSEDSESSSSESSADLNHISNKESSSSKGIYRAKPDNSESSRNKTDKYGNQGYYKQKCADSSGDKYNHDFEKRKHAQDSDSCKRRKILSSSHKYFTSSQLSSDESSKGSSRKRNFDGNSEGSSSSPFKTESLSKHKNSKHYKYDSSSDSESDSDGKKNTSGKGRYHEYKHKSSSYQNHKHYHSSSNLDHSRSEKKHKNSESAYRDKYSSTDSHETYNKEECHRQDSSFHKRDKKER